MGWEVFDRREQRKRRGRESYKPSQNPGRPRQTHCIHGHPLDTANTYEYQLPDGRIQRQCKTCRRERQKSGAMNDYRIERAAQALCDHDIGRGRGKRLHIGDMSDGDAYREIAIKMVSAADDEAFEFPPRRRQQASLHVV